MTHHPHVHMIVPGGGIARDGSRWINARPAFLLPVRVLGKLFRRPFLTRLIELHDAGKLVFFGAQAELADRRRFLRHLAPLRNKRWVVYAKAPFAGPEAVLAYLSLYTHRVAISNSRRIRHCGLFASATRKANIARVRELLAVAPAPEPIEAAEPPDQLPPCPCCSGRMRIIETFERWMQPRAPPRAPAATGTPP